MKITTVKSQRLREGASDWYMRFHSNFDKDKRWRDILNPNDIIPVLNQVQQLKIEILLKLKLYSDLLKS